MSREIKFRLIFDGKIVGYEKHSFDTACGIFHSEDGKNWYNINVKNNLNKWIWHTTKEQYAGLKDCNGKEIYEGDILKIDGSSMYSGDKEYIGEFQVISDLGSWGYEFWFEIRNGYECPTHITESDYSNVEIIGNIHEKEKHNG